MGMLPPTLFDVAAITGLKPLGEIPNFPTFDKEKHAGVAPVMTTMSVRNFRDNWAIGSLLDLKLQKLQ